MLIVEPFTHGAHGTGHVLWLQMHCQWWQTSKLVTREHIGIVPSNLVEGLTT